MQLCNHCIIYCRGLCLVFVFGYYALSVLPIVMTVKLHPSQDGVHYVPAEKSTIKCSSMKSAVFLIAHNPLKVRVHVNA